MAQQKKLICPGVAVEASTGAVRICVGVGGRVLQTYCKLWQVTGPLCSCNKQSFDVGAPG